MSFDERYRAISSRDTRFDGQFVTAVRTTGIYCRPSCPARTPKPTNVSFFATSAAAHEAGYRACKRCLPEAAPGSPEWDLRGDAAGRAMRLIADGVIEREGVPGLASRLGYSPRHLTRMLAAELGAGPLALARAQRAHTARMLLVGTDLTAADVAFSAGFTSVRQFNDTVREVFGMTPTELRARYARRGRTRGCGANIRLALPYRLPFDAAGLFAWMSARAVPGVEVASSDSFARTLRLPGGPAWFRVRDAPAQGRLVLEARVARPADLASLVARVRRLFDLDADPLAIDAALSVDSLIAERVRAVPGLRVPGAADPHDADPGDGRSADHRGRRADGAHATDPRLGRRVELPGREPSGCSRRCPRSPSTAPMCCVVPVLGSAPSRPSPRPSRRVSSISGRGMTPRRSARYCSPCPVSDPGPPTMCGCA